VTDIGIILSNPRRGAAFRSFLAERGCDVLELPSSVYGALPKGNQLILAEAAYKERARKAHPDAGGTAEAMAELNVAIGDAREELG
jgi:hypothetical protein